MHLRPYMILISLVLFTLLAPLHAGAAGEVGGSLLYGAGQYRAEVAGEEVQEITTQYAQAGMFYKVNGLIGGSRFGNYSLMLGYEFNVLDPTITNNGIQDPTVNRIEEGKLLYNGSFVIAPGGLPVRLSGYSRDIHRTSFSSSRGRTAILPVGLQPGSTSNSTSLVSPAIITDIENGTHHEFGMTALFGIRNGSYLGAYRDSLAQLPRLLIDYKQVDVQDLSADSDQQHYRARDLAFISLNKIDNWIHVRRQDYQDYLNEMNDTETSQILIGSIDHTLSRQWINLTNWIKISGDLSFNTEKNKGFELPENRYNVNLFAVATRLNYNASVFSTFERTTQGERINQELNVPVYFTYEPNRESYYRGSLRGEFDEQKVIDGSTYVGILPETKSSALVFDLSSELFRTKNVLFKPMLNLRANETNLSQALSEKLTLEWLSRKSNSSLPWNVGYYIASTQSKTDSEESSLYVEQSLYGRIEKDLDKSKRIGLRASLRHGSGNIANDGTEDITDRLEIGSGTGINKSETDRFLLYDASIFLEHTGRIFLNRFEVIFEGIRSDVAPLTSTEITHYLKMNSRHSTFTLTSSLLRGTQIRIKKNDLDYLDDTTSGEYGSSLSSSGIYTYTPGRHLALTLSGGANHLSGGQRDVTEWIFSEKLEYRFYTNNGVVRRLAEISQEVVTERTSRVMDRSRVDSLHLVAALYPSKSYYVKVASGMAFYSPSGSEQLSLNGETGFNFDKLQVALCYSRGYKTAEGLLAGVKEEAWNMKIKKIF